ncbi:MAG: hypothetical protein SCK70_01735, partial [bacterium]|nr:hypothetical protein [bacterium]
IPRELAPPFLWTRISARLDERNQKGYISQFESAFLLGARMLAATVVVLLMIFTGIQLGKMALPAAESSQKFSQTALINEEFRMDYFSITPPGSVGEPVVALTANNNRSRR